MEQIKSKCAASEAVPAERQLAEDTFSFCMEHMQEHFTIPFLAARAGISPTKLKQIYRRVYGASLFAHIRKEKMHWAAQMLASSNTRVIDIAETCGYDNASKFSAAFCDIMGCTPTAYRSCVRSE
jgi:AraC-like DNA-binding protein